MSQQRPGPAPVIKLRRPVRRTLHAMPLQETHGATRVKRARLSLHAAMSGVAPATQRAVSARAAQARWPWTAALASGALASGMTVLLGGLPSAWIAAPLGLFVAWAVLMTARIVLQRKAMQDNTDTLNAAQRADALWSQYGHTLDAANQARLQALMQQLAQLLPAADAASRSGALSVEDSYHVHRAIDRLLPAACEAYAGAQAKSDDALGAAAREHLAAHLNAIATQLNAVRDKLRSTHVERLAQQRSFMQKRR
jgi:hypothetical protein